MNRNMKRTVGLLGTMMCFGWTQAVPISGQGTWETTLKGRDIHGHAVALNDAKAAFFYDASLDITWLRDWNANDGPASWYYGTTWADELSIGGFEHWRLPTVDEFARTYQVTLGNLWDPGMVNTAYFENVQPSLNWLQPSRFWSSTVFPPDEIAAWSFDLYWGYQNLDERDRALFAVAVRPGDVLTVPEPRTAVLVLAGLTALAIRRRRRTPTASKSPADGSSR